MCKCVISLTVLWKMIIKFKAIVSSCILIMEFSADLVFVSHLLFIFVSFIIVVFLLFCYCTKVKALLKFLTLNFKNL
jgi:hypothetical protein